MADIVLDGVSRGFPAAGAVLRNFCLHVPAGERFVLVGPSGSGKSTLLRLLAGLERPSAGCIRIGGRDVTHVPAHRRNVAMVFQEEALLPHLTVGEHLAFGGRFAGHGWGRGRRTGREELSAQVAWVAERLQIAALRDRRCTDLSAGERRRVAIGRALVRQAEVLLLDEPLSNLDAALQEELAGLLVQATRETGATCVWVTHDQAEAQAVADRLGVLGRGELQQIGVPREVYDRPVNRFVAGSVGRPRMSLLDGRLRADNPGVTFESRGGWTLEIRATCEIEVLNTRKGELPEITCGVRPEWLRVSIADSDETSGTAAVVASVESVGGRDLVGLRPASGGHAEALLGYLPSGVAGVGAAVRVALDERKVQWFNEKSGVNLQPVQNGYEPKQPVVSAK